MSAAFACEERNNPANVKQKTKTTKAMDLCKEFAFGVGGAKLIQEVYLPLFKGQE